MEKIPNLRVNTYMEKTDQIPNLEANTYMEKDQIPHLRVNTYTEKTDYIPNLIVNSYMETIQILSANTYTDNPKSQSEYLHREDLKSSSQYLHGEEGCHHLDTLVCPLLVVVLGSLYRVKQTVTVIGHPQEESTHPWKFKAWTTSLLAQIHTVTECQHHSCGTWKS